MKIPDNIVWCVLIDNGNSTDILFLDAFTKLKIEEAVLMLIQTPLYASVNECVRVAGLVCLLITIGDGSEKAT